MIRLRNDILARLLHQPLYDRIVKFAQDYTPEGMAEMVATAWLNALYSGDPNIHILVDIDEKYNILGHAVIDVQNTFGVKVGYCHQVQGEKNSVVALHEGMEYIDKLMEEAGATYVIIYLAKGSKAMEKHGYKTVRTMMMKTVGDSDG